MSNSIAWVSGNFQKQIPLRFREITWDVLTEISPEDKAIARKYVIAFPEHGRFKPTDKTSIYLSTDKSGTGKTGYSICLATDLIITGHISGYCLFKSYVILMDDLRQDKDFTIRNEVFRKIQNSSFTIFDDIGVKKINTSVAERYYMVLDYLWLNMKPAIFTSKFTINQLVNRFTDDVDIKLIESIASRLVGLCQEVELGNVKDYRVA